MKTSFVRILALVIIILSLSISIYADASIFSDVPEGSYYEDAVKWAYDSGVTQGISKTLFNPNGNCTRGQVVTFLWRAAGQPEVDVENNPFVDVKPTDYYFKPVIWAYMKGITTGTGANNFSPDQECSSAHIITFLYREYNFRQGKFVDGYYEEARDWANELSLLENTGLRVEPTEMCPRSAVVTFLYRWALDAEQSSNIETDIFTDKELDEMAFVDDAIEKLYNSEIFKNANTQERMELASKLVDELVEKGLIVKNSVYKDEEMISFEYSSGAYGGIDVKYWDPLFN